MRSGGYKYIFLIIWNFGIISALILSSYVQTHVIYIISFFIFIIWFLQTVCVLKNEKIKQTNSEQAICI